MGTQPRGPSPNPMPCGSPRPTQPTARVPSERGASVPVLRPLPSSLWSFSGSHLAVLASLEQSSDLLLHHLDSFLFALLRRFYGQDPACWLKVLSRGPQVWPAKCAELGPGHGAGPTDYRMGRVRQSWAGRL